MIGGRVISPDVRKIISPIALAMAGVVRDRNSSPVQIREALSRLGREFSREISSWDARLAEVVTPLGEAAQVVTLHRGLTAVVTTKGDYDTFGLSLASALEPSIVGYMNFEGRRAQAALNTPIREVELPAAGNRQVGSLVVAKSVLATGCTAISLTDTAFDLYRPGKLIICSIFYSLSGVCELVARFPAATVLVLGEPDKIDENGILHPGVGLLEERI
ncbi:uracil phosphoribosyltransferase [Nocardia niigatensis]